MQTVTFKCPDKLAMQLKAESLIRNITKSELMCHALAYYLLHEGMAAEQPSLYSLLRDLCGSIEGPANLSEQKPEY